MKNLGLFADAVDEALSVLGESPKEAIYEFLQNDYGIEKNEIPNRFREFSSILEETVGPSSDQVLEFIIERFYVKLNLEIPTSTTICDAIENVQKLLKAQPNTVHIEKHVALPPDV